MAPSAGIRPLGRTGFNAGDDGDRARCRAQRRDAGRLLEAVRRSSAGMGFVSAPDPILRGGRSRCVGRAVRIRAGRSAAAQRHRHCDRAGLSRPARPESHVSRAASPSHGPRVPPESVRAAGRRGSRCVFLMEVVQGRRIQAAVLAAGRPRHRSDHSANGVRERRRQFRRGRRLHARSIDRRESSLRGLAAARPR